MNADGPMAQARRAAATTFIAGGWRPEHLPPSGSYSGRMAATCQLREVQRNCWTEPGGSGSAWAELLLIWRRDFHL